MQIAALLLWMAAMGAVTPRRFLVPYSQRRFPSKLLGGTPNRPFTGLGRFSSTSPGQNTFGPNRFSSFNPVGSPRFSSGGPFSGRRPDFQQGQTNDCGGAPCTTDFQQNNDCGGVPCTTDFQQNNDCGGVPCTTDFQQNNDCGGVPCTTDFQQNNDCGGVPCTTDFQQNNDCGGVPCTTDFQQNNDCGGAPCRTAGRPAPSPVSSDNDRYFFSWLAGDLDPRNKYTWKQANDECKNRGYKLISLDSAQNDQIVYDQVALHDVSYLWTSGRWRPSGRSFFWSTGEPVNSGYSNWSPTGATDLPQPDNREQPENCLAVLDNAYDDDIKWHAIHCEHFVCEKF